MKHGLVGRSAIERRPNTMNVVFNDCHRWDGHKNAICLSIGFPNDFLLRKYRRNAPGEKWMILEIDASALWELDCAFCRKNASSDDVRRIALNELKSPEALNNLFDSYHIAVPKDSQAEVLVFEKIDSHKYLKRIHFSCGEDLTRAAGQERTSMPPLFVTPEFFGTRPRELR